MRFVLLKIQFARTYVRPDHPHCLSTPDRSRGSLRRLCRDARTVVHAGRRKGNRSGISLDQRVDLPRPHRIVSGLPTLQSLPVVPQCCCLVLSKGAKIGERLFQFALFLIQAGTRLECVDIGGVQFNCPVDIGQTFSTSDCSSPRNTNASDSVSLSDPFSRRARALSTAFAARHDPPRAAS